MKPRMPIPVVWACLAWSCAAVGAGNDPYGDPLPDGAVSRLGTYRFRARDDMVKNLQFSPDGNTLLTVGGDLNLRIWETSTGRLLREVQPASLNAGHVPISPDGKRIAVSGGRRFDDGRPGFEAVCILVDTSTGQEVRALSWGGEEGDLTIVFSPDGKLLVSIEFEGPLRIQEADSGRVVAQQRFPRDVVTSLAVSPDSKTVAIWSGPNTKKLYLWDWQSSDAPRELDLARHAVQGPVFSPDGKTMVACAVNYPFVYEWDVATGRLEHELKLREDVMPAAVVFHPDGKMLAVCDRGNHTGKNFSGGVLLIERGTGNLLHELATPGLPANRAVFSNDGHWLAAMGDGGVHVWDLFRYEQVPAGTAGHQGSITQVIAGHDGLIATASDDHTARLWDGGTGRERLRLQHGHWVRAIALSPNERLLASSSLDDSVALWDVKSGKQIYKVAGHGNTGGRRVVGFTPDGQSFLSCGDDMELRVWDVETGKALAEVPVRPENKAVPKKGQPPDVRQRVAKGLLMGPGVFAPGSRRLVTSLRDTFYIFDTASGKADCSVKHPGGSLISSIAVSPDGKLLATSGWGKPIETPLPNGRMHSRMPDEHPVCLIDLETCELLRQLDLPTSEAGPVAFSADGKLLAVGWGQSRGEVRLLDVATQELVAVLSDLGSGPHAMAFSPEGQYLITTLNDQTALVWDLAQVLAKKTGRSGP